MPNLIITCGISGSGKSTYADEFCSKHPEYVRIERDIIRQGVVGYNPHKMKKSVESMTTLSVERMWKEAVELGKPVVVSDTNLDMKYINAWEDKAKEAGYKFKIKYFDVDLETAIKRDKERERTVGMSVIMKQYENYQKVSLGYNYKDYDYAHLPKCIIVDIDGTIAQMKGRSPYDWYKVGEDKLREDVKEMVLAVAERNDASIIFVSGRDGICYDETHDWLVENFSEVPFTLYMRPEGNTQKDTLIKEEIFHQQICGIFDVVAVFDDRPSVVRMWHSMGMNNVFCVGNPYIEF